MYKTRYDFLNFRRLAARCTARLYFFIFLRRHVTDGMVREEFASLSVNTIVRRCLCAWLAASKILSYYDGAASRGTGRKETKRTYVCLIVCKSRGHDRRID